MMDAIKAEDQRPRMNSVSLTQTQALLKLQELLSKFQEECGKTVSDLLVFHEWPIQMKEGNDKFSLSRVCFEMKPERYSPEMCIRLTLFITIESFEQGLVTASGNYETPSQFES